MKRTLPLVVLAVSSLTVAATLVQAICGNQPSAIRNSQQVSSQLQADGSAPPPPWPPLNSVLVADGSAPPPPWPTFNSVLVADGSAPPPPWPTFNSVLVTDGSAPPPPWPTQISQT